MRPGGAINMHPLSWGGRNGTDPETDKKFERLEKAQKYNDLCIDVTYKQFSKCEYSLLKSKRANLAFVTKFCLLALHDRLRTEIFFAVLFFKDIFS